MIDTYPGGFAVIRYPMNYAVVDMSQDHRPIVATSKNRATAHRKARKLGQQRQRGAS